MTSQLLLAYECGRSHLGPGVIQKISEEEIQEEPLPKEFLLKEAAWRVGMEMDGDGLISAWQRLVSA